MGQEFNFDLGLPASPVAGLDPKIAGELRTIYNSLRILADQIGGGNLLGSISHTAVAAVSGWGTLGATSSIVYRYLNLDMIWVNYYLTGVSTSTGISFELPTNSADPLYCPTGHAVDNSVILAASGQAVVAAESNLVTIYSDLAGAGWTASGTKSVAGQFIYRSA